jgi:hypothetical protein
VIQCRTIRFLSSFRAIGMFLLTTDHDREVSLLVYAPTPRIEGSCE